MNNTASEAARQKWLPLIACAAGFVIIAIGCLILACWILRVAPLMAAFPQFGAMNPVTAGLVIIAGIALHRFGTRKQQGRFDKIGILLASILVLASAARLVGFIAGPKSILAFEAPGLSYPVSREIAPNTAICLLLCGVGLLLADRRGRSFLRASQVMVILSGVIALLAVVGYSYQVLFLSRFKGFMPMALETAVALIVFCAGFLAARPKRGVMALITSPSSGGAVVRRLLPVAILIPWLLGGVFLLIQESTDLRGDTAISLFAVSSIVIFSGLILWHAKMLHQADLERTEAEIKLRAASVNLERSNTDLQQFAYVASHDLFEPLRMVTSYLELVRDRAEAKLDPESREFIGFALDGARRMRALITDLLEYSRLEVRAPVFKPVDCEEVLAAAVSNLKVAIEESGATVRHGPLPTVMADRVQLIQVFQNFIGNALKFRGSEPPVINISAREKDRDWVFAVQDNGIGIDPKFFGRIFAIFQRLHTAREYSGTGIGLAVCKKIIERSGGRVWVESEPGKGSTFFFTLPSLLPKAEKPAAKETG